MPGAPARRGFVPIRIQGVRNSTIFRHYSPEIRRRSARSAEKTNICDAYTSIFIDRDRDARTSIFIDSRFTFEQTVCFDDETVREINSITNSILFEEFLEKLWKSLENKLVTVIKI